MRILLTGGTGSLGKAILARAESGNWGHEITVYSRDEVKQGQLRIIYPQHRYILGDVRMEKPLAQAMYKQDLVIHAAAYKQVPQAEWNATECIETNVVGSMNVARLASLMGVKKVIGISTDKACAPINTYGMTKALMEKLFAQACLWSDTIFVCVRYGNVLGSRGSVIPMFREAINRRERVKLTDPKMTRFWLTIDDAVDLVEDAMQLDIPGSVLVPRARSTTMRELVRAISPKASRECDIVGIRPGERIHESLIHEGESMKTDELGDSQFLIWPAYTNHVGSLPPGFVYSSKRAERIPIKELRLMITEGGCQA